MADVMCALCVVRYMIETRGAIPLGFYRKRVIHADLDSEEATEDFSMVVCSPPLVQ